MHSNARNYMTLIFTAEFSSQRCRDITSDRHVSWHRKWGLHSAVKRTVTWVYEFMGSRVEKDNA